MVFAILRTIVKNRVSGLEAVCFRQEHFTVECSRLLLVGTGVLGFGLARNKILQF